MKLRIRFIAFFVISLIGFIVLMGFLIAFLQEVILPMLNMGYGSNEWVDLAVIVVPFLVGGILLGAYTVAPILMIIAMVARLTKGEYAMEGIEKKLYDKKGKLKFRYYLYQEVVDNLYALAANLEDAQNQRQKLEEAKKNWIRGVSHDLKTPLTYVTGYSGLLLKDDGVYSEDEKRKYIGEIHRKGNYIANLIDDLNFSFKMDTLLETLPIEKTDFDAVDFLQRLTADVANDPKAAGYDLGFFSEVNALRITADPKLLQRAILNIIVNAVYHNPNGTSVLTGVMQKDKVAVIFVEDNGNGMDAEAQATIFEKYNRSGTRDAGDNGGYGMSVVKSVIEAHNGTITIESEPGKGTRFEIALPNP